MDLIAKKKNNLARKHIGEEYQKKSTHTRNKHVKQI